jgi:adenosylhomocysteine nucleosidase
VDPTPLDGILILTGVELEATALARHLDLPPAPTLPGRAFGRGCVRVAPAGVGAALLETRWPGLLHGLTRPLVVSAGVCGALDPALPPGALICPERVQTSDGADYHLVDRCHRDRLAAGCAATIHGGMLVGTREIVAGPADKARLRRRTGAAAVDMESAAIVGAAAAAGLPWLVLRGVSDGAVESVPPGLVRLVGPEGRLRIGGAVALAMTRPRVISRAIGLGRTTRRALVEVARALSALAA